jgi:UDP-N-acetylmuramate dehydrogenase
MRDQTTTGAAEQITAYNDEKLQLPAATVGGRPLRSDRLSTFRTTHDFERVADVRSEEDFDQLIKVAKQERREMLTLGNGSNTLFVTRSVRTLIMRNRLPKELIDLGDGKVSASSSVMIASILKLCRGQRRSSFYYLASVPATVGGALAMNAGRGRSYGVSIYDFVETVTFREAGVTRTISKKDIQRDYRWTIFTGKTSKLILGATFVFPAAADGHVADEIRERVRYSKETQDHSFPNCGTAFKLASPRIMRWFQGVRIGKAQFSTRTPNWISNDGKSSRPIVWLIRLVRMTHRIFLRRAELEFIEVK